VAAVVYCMILHVGYITYVRQLCGCWRPCSRLVTSSSRPCRCPSNSLAAVTHDHPPTYIITFPCVSSADGSYLPQWVLSQLRLALGYCAVRLHFFVADWQIVPRLTGLPPLSNITYRITDVASAPGWRNIRNSIGNVSMSQATNETRSAESTLW